MDRIGSKILTYRSRIVFKKKFSPSFIFDTYSAVCYKVLAWLKTMLP
eukprot:UN01669